MTTTPNDPPQPGDEFMPRDDDAYYDALDDDDAYYDALDDELEYAAHHGGTFARSWHR